MNTAATRDRTAPHRHRDLLRLVIAVLAITILPACVTRGPEQRALNVIMAHKETSLGDWRDLETDGLSSLHVFRAKTAMLVNAAHLSIDSGTDGGAVIAKFNMKLDPDGGAGVGSAVPVTRDGYFLTAAHCVTEMDRHKPLTTVVALVDRDKGEFAQAPFRVVWKSDDIEGYDLALIHAPIRPWQSFKLAPANKIAAELPVAAAGWSGIFEGQALPVAAGKVLEISDAGPLGRGVTHNVPLNQGDSGGPLIDRQGRLVAINFLIATRTHRWFKTTPRSEQRLMADYRGFAIAPDAAWLRKTIAEDRRR